MLKLRGATRALGDARGISTVEFALLLPLLVLLYLGGVELTNALDANRKLTDLTRTVADILAKSDSLTARDLAQLSALTGPLMAPHEAKKALIRIVAVWTDQNSASTVDWSFAAVGTGMAGGGAPVPGAAFSLPASLTAASRQTLVATIEYQYTPTFGVALTGPLNFTETVYSAPRSGKCVKRSDMATSICNR